MIIWVNQDSPFSSLNYNYMKKETTKIKYFLYARKSSESEDRQMASIESQIEELKKMAKQNNLEIIEIFSESKSAKAPGRPIFNKMIEKIKKGEAKGIICWKLNRLARNPVDGGEVSWMIQQGIIQHIQTFGRSYYPNDNVIVMAVELGMANQFIRDLSVDTKRGMKTRLEKGLPNGVVPQGYLNNKENKTTVKDPERFDLVRKMWDLMLTSNYTPPKILDIANNEWGYRTRKFKRIGGNPLSRSGIYKIFTNLFYAGIIESKGLQYEGKYERMITLEEYDRVQIILGKEGKPRPQKHQFAFTGSIRCSVCGCLYTAETKKKLLKSGEIREHTYYHCTRKTTKIKCDQRKNIPLADLELSIEKEIEKYTILPEFLEWAVEGLSKKNNTEIEDRTKIYETQNNAIIQLQKELDELTKMRYRQLIDDEAFIKEKNQLQSQIVQLKGKLKETESRAEEWLELTEKTFNFATYARKTFITAKGKEGLELKKEILMTLGKTPIIKDNKLIIEPDEWFIPIKNSYPALMAEYIRLEPTKIPMDKTKTEALASVRTRWLCILKLVRTFFAPRQTRGESKPP